MSRMNLLMAVAVAAGVVGCAQCDTCDDFPVPCVGPNCGQGLMPGGMPGYLDSQTAQGPPVMGAATPTMPMGDDYAGPAPVAPPMNPPPPSAEPPASPPTPMEPAPAPR